MKGLAILLLLSSALQSCTAAPPLEPVTCMKNGSAAAARAATHQINENHDHGYKFKLNVIQGHKIQKVFGGCDIDLKLDLLETECHKVHPTHFEDCIIYGEDEREVMANCSVKMTVRNGYAQVTKYECGTRQAKTAREMVTICADCPTMISLTSPKGLKGVQQAVQKFNQNTTNQHYYSLQEVGRMTTGYIMNVGMNYYAQIVLVENSCPMGSTEECYPICPDRAHHAFCRMSYSNARGIRSLECEYFPPSNTDPLQPHQLEPICMDPPPPTP
ncbi:antihemorrhagic factor cHLP-B-like [Cottoperca gobio]|uniref:Antihemorrhagic factor cHLP-B-like n=1 Tax=Cottoperca gobio TaxID=56716 RepID=A0A6J2PJW1_COTGO|nr:antihemorrhagic factor cHLP-B-like [Cottoperca gobio]